MQLDYRSVLFTISFVMLMIALLMGTYAITARQRRRGVEAWAAAYGMLFLGTVLVALRGAIPDLLSILLGNLLLIGFFVFILVGIRRYRGKASSRTLIAAAFVLIAAWIGYFSFISPSALPRFIFFDLAVIGLASWAGIEIGRKPSPDVRVLSGILRGLFFSFALVYALRLALTLLEGGTSDLLSLRPWDGAILAVGGVLVSILSLCLILLHSSILTEELAAAARDRALLVREMAHRTKNDLALVDSLISIDQMSTKAEDPRGSERLGSLRDRIRCLSYAHERLSQSEDLGIIRLDEYLEVIAQGLPGRAGVRVEKDFAPAAAPFAYAAPLGLAMNELATNALKHAFPEGRGGCVSLSLRVAPAAASGESAAVLTVRDDGVGALWPPQKPGLGTEIVRSFAAKIGAKIDYEFEGGSVFRLSFSLPPRSAGG